MYASDITRTFPVSGTFTSPQRDLYEAVLGAQKECVQRCKVEDGVSLNELHRASESPLQRSGRWNDWLIPPGCTLLNENLKQIGFKLSIGDVERKLVSLALDLAN